MFVRCLRVALLVLPVQEQRQAQPAREYSRPLENTLVR